MTQSVKSLSYSTRKINTRHKKCALNPLLLYICSAFLYRRTLNVYKRLKFAQNLGGL